MSIQVAVQGAKTFKVEFQKGITLAKVLKSAKVKPTKTATITVDGKKATKKTKLEKESVVVVTPKVKNG